MAPVGPRVVPEHLDLWLMRHGPVLLYLKPEVLEDDITWLLQHQYVVHRFASDTWKIETDSLAAVADALGFPNNRGRRNFSGFWDCLPDIHVPEEGGLALVFVRFDHFSHQYSKFAWNLLDCIARASWEFLLTGRRLMVLMQSDDPTIWFEDVGGHTPWMNDREHNDWMPAIPQERSPPPA